jgi:hypothetical protein
MSHTLDSFAARVREILQQEDNPGGRDKVAALLREALADRAFVEPLFDAASPTRRAVRRTTTDPRGRSTARPTERRS